MFSKQGEPFFIILDSFVAELNLSGLELLVYSLIYSFCTQGRGQYNGSLRYIARRTHASKNGVRKALSRLISKGLIEKTAPKIIGNTPTYTISGSCASVHSVYESSTQSVCTDTLGGNNTNTYNNTEYLEMTRSQLLGITNMDERTFCVKVFAYLFSNEDIDSESSAYLRIAELMTEMMTQPSAVYKGKSVDADRVWKMFVMNLKDDSLGLSIRDFIFAVMIRIERLNTRDIIDPENYMKALIWSMLQKGSLSD